MTDSDNGDWTIEDDPAADWREQIPEGGNWEEWKAPMSTRKRLLIVAGIVLALALAVIGAANVWVQGKIDPSGPPGEAVELEVPAGATTEDIGVLLADNDVISSSTIWDYWTRFKDKGPFQAGLYVFQVNSSFDEAVAVLAEGPRPPESDRVTIPEGLTVREIVVRMGDPELGLERWDSAVAQSAVDSGQIRSRFQPAGVSSLEGLLFPDTYEVADDADERTFLQRIVSEMDERLTALDVENRAAALGLTPYQVVIVASLIEEEARVPEEQSKISRVIHNRLAQGIPLGIDATNRYEAELAGRDRDDIDFDSDSPYNTRRVQGLPPTPIASPGQAALEAALSPAEGPWIYYVLADAEGHHVFTDSAAEFQRAKQECIRLNLGCG